MILFTSIPLLAITVAVNLIHIAGGFSNGILSKILKYFNIALHIPAGLLLIYFKAPAQEGVVFYMLSLAVYLSVYCIRFRLEKRREDKNDL